MYRLWRVRTEQIVIANTIEYADVKSLEENRNRMLCFEGTEITLHSLKKYEKKLDKELKKIQKEIEEFRENSLK